MYSNKLIGNSIKGKILTMAIKMLYSDLKKILNTPKDFLFATTTNTNDNDNEKISVVLDLCKIYSDELETT